MHNEAAVTMDAIAHQPLFANESGDQIHGLEPSPPDFMSVDGFFKLYFVIFGQVLAVYYGTAILLHFVAPSVIHVDSVQGSKSQSREDTRRDAARSVLPLVIKTFTLFVAEILHRSGFGVLQDVSLVETLSTPTGILGLVALVFVLDIFHDTWFYFVHRLLHRPWFMKNIHWMHHQSMVPSAFTGYSFHWIEAFMVFSNAIVEIFLFPIPFAFHRIYELWMVVIHVGGHCGYEVAPYIPHLGQALWWLTGCGRKKALLLNTVDHHDIHHKHPKVHFSLYFTHWDMWLGTMHPDYCKRHQ